MFTRIQFALALLAVCLFSLTSTPAQMFQIGGAGGGTMPKYPLLFNKNVQLELKLQGDQLKKVMAKIKELTPEGSMIMPGKAGEDGAPPKVTMSFQFKSADGNSPPVGGGVAVDPSNFKIPGMPDFKKIDEEVNKLLEQPQRDRLKQLALQRQGLSAIAQEDVAKELQLESEQKDLIKHIMDDQKKRTSEFFQEMLQNGGGAIEQDKVVSFMKKQREQTENDLGLLLTPEQKAKWEELQGAKFDLKK